MFRKLFLPGVVIAAVYPSLGQTPAPPPAPTVPDNELFRFYFVHVAAVQKAADNLKAQGKEDMSMRVVMKNQARLTDQEFAFLVNLAANCNSAFAAESKNAVAALAPVKAKYSNPSAIPPDVLQQMNALESQRQQVITDCIASLKSQMGPARFQALYDFVVTSEAPNINQPGVPRPLPHGGKPPAPPPPQ
jgi:hypothetical protein